MKKIFIRLIAILICSVLLFTSCDVVDFDFIKSEFSGNDQADAAEKIKATDFHFYNSMGNKVNFSDFKGKPAVVYLWITGLSSVREELEYLDKKNREYGDQINFMMIHLTDERFETQAKAKTAAEGLTVPVYYDIDKSCEFVFDAKTLDKFPRMILFDKDGYIIHDEAGALCFMNSNLDENIPRLAREEPYVTKTLKDCNPAPFR